MSLWVFTSGAKGLIFLPLSNRTAAMAASNLEVRILKQKQCTLLFIGCHPKQFDGPCCRDTSLVKYYFKYVWLLHKRFNKHLFYQLISNWWSWIISDIRWCTAFKWQRLGRQTRCGGYCGSCFLHLILFILGYVVSMAVGCITHGNMNHLPCSQAAWFNMICHIGL